MADITAIILTKNEEHNIKDCINSITDVCARIIVVDSYSMDKTTEIAKSLGADVYEHEFVNYSKQFSYGQHNTGIQTKWILRFDADERMTPEVCAEVEKICVDNADTNVNGVLLRFDQKFLGRVLRHGGMYPFKKLLIFKTGIGEIEDRNMDEHIVLSQGTVIECLHDCHHLDDTGLTNFITKHNWYASREMQDYFESINDKREIGNISLDAKIRRFIKTKVYYNLPMGMRAHFYYWYRYYLLGGFLDGKEGKIYAFMQAYWYRYLVDAKIYEKQK